MSDMTIEVDVYTYPPVLDGLQGAAGRMVVSHERGKAIIRTRAGEDTEAVIDGLLRDAEAGRWYDLSQLADEIREATPDFVEQDTGAAGRVSPTEPPDGLARTQAQRP